MRKAAKSRLAEHLAEQRAYLLSLRGHGLAHLLGGESLSRDKYGREGASDPDIGHSAKDRSLEVRIDPTQPDGLFVKPWAPGGDSKRSKDYVLRLLGFPVWQPGAMSTARWRTRHAEAMPAVNTNCAPAPESPSSSTPTCAAGSRPAFDHQALLRRCVRARPVLHVWCGRQWQGRLPQHAHWSSLDYVTVSSIETFAASKSDRHPTDFAMLRGARLVTAQETEEGRAWNETRIKALTGGDPITARFMRQDFFTYSPTFKLVIAGNHKPNLRSVDDAARRRFHIIPFTNKPKVVDRHLAEKLKAKWPGILRWAIDGCVAWQQGGLNPPVVVLEATANYFDEQDLFRQWVEECCDVGPGKKRHAEGTVRVLGGILRAKWRQGRRLEELHPADGQSRV
jgi:hypothetical protein